MKYYIIAGEASGDLHSSNLIFNLKKFDPDAHFRGWGGELMKKEGMELVKHYRDLAFMGFTEVLLNIKTILKNIAFCKKDVLEYKPDVLILVDYPGFNLRIAEFAHEHGIKVFYYISPQVWAWKESRVKKIKKVVDQMFVILPFETEFYKKHNYKVDFVGHPLLDAIQKEKEKETDKNFFEENNLTIKPIIALLPGSRKQEISIMLPIMLSVKNEFKDYQLVIAGAPSVDEDFYKEVAGDDIKIVFGKTYALLKHSFAALVTSGTATLEAALFEVPQVVCYKGGSISYQIAKRLINVKYISLVNLIMDKTVIKELIQNDLNKENLEVELKKITKDSRYRNELKKGYEELRIKLGGKGASEKAASLMNKYLKST